MRKAELSAGDEVFVRLPYDGGSGWARIIDTDAVPRHDYPTRTVHVTFLPGEAPATYLREHCVAPNRITRRRDAS